MNKDFKNTVISGLQTFRALGFPGMPSEDRIETVAEVWWDLLHPLRDWNKQKNIDALIDAFKTTARKAERFPVPSQVMANFVDPVEVIQTLPRPPVSEADKAAIEALAASALKQLGVKK